MLNADTNPDLRPLEQNFEIKELCPLPSSLSLKGTKPDGMVGRHRKNKDMQEVGTVQYLMGGHDLPLAGQADVVKQFLVS
jgi:hypothetical protein